MEEKHTKVESMMRQTKDLVETGEERPSAKV